MRRILSVGAVLALALSSGAWASPASQVAETAASQGPAADPQQAASHAAQLAPKVAQAISSGEGAEVRALAAHNPDVAAAALPYATQSTSRAPSNGKQPPASLARKRTRAHAAACYGAVWMQQNWDFGGGVIGWLYERDNGWCGSSGRITWPGGATFAAWTWGPYCFAGKGADYSWDVYPSWIHTAHWGTLGVSYPWGCWGLRGGKVQIRTAWNGYFDYYNDYGF